MRTRLYLSRLLPLTRPASQSATIMKSKRLRRWVVLFTAFNLQLSAAIAAARFWDGGDATRSGWSYGANWDGNSAPVAGDTLVFPAGAARLANSNNFSAYTTFAGIIFQGDNYSISGNPVTIVDGISARAGAVGNVFRPTVRLGAATAGISVSAASAQLTMVSDIELNGYDLSLYSLGELHCSGTISGSAGVITGGSGRTIFDGIEANTYTGETTVGGGLLELSRYIVINPGAIRVGRVAVPGNLTIGGGVGPTIGDAVRCQAPSQIATGAVVTVNQTGELNLNGYNHTVRSLSIRGGNVLTGTGTLSLTGSNLLCERYGNVASDPDGSFISGRLNFVGAGPKFIDVQPPNALLTVSAVVTGAPNATIVKTSEGELHFTSGNTYAGATILRQGKLRVSADNGLGSGTNGVTIESGVPIMLQGTELILINSTIANKSLTIRKQGLAVSTEGLTSSWLGDLVLEDFATLETRGNSVLHQNGAISGPGGIAKIGSGTLQLAGAAPNTYAGFTRTRAGELTLLKSNAVAIPGPMTVGEGAGEAAIVRAVNAGGGGVSSDQIGDAAAVEVRATGKLILEHDERLGSLAGSGALELGGKLEVGFNNSSTAFSGDIVGAGGELSKIGTGTLTLSGNNTGAPARVQAGAIILDGSSTAGVEVRPGGRLGGHGSIGTHLSMRGGTMEPGTSPGQLTVNGDVQAGAAPSIFRFELNGTASSQYDRLVVGQNVNLAGISLEVVPGPSFPLSSHFTILEKLGGAPIASTFEGLPEGATFSAGGQIFSITYQGGSGNDVVLTRGGTFLVSFGLPHIALEQATLTPGLLGELVVSNLAPSGRDGVFIPLDDAQGWQGQITALDPGRGRGRFGWEIQGQQANRPLQTLSRGAMEVIDGEIHAFADTSPIGATGHWVEVFAGNKFVRSAAVYSNAPLFRLLPPFTNPPPTLLRCGAPFTGKPAWSFDLIWPEPHRLLLPGTNTTPVDEVTRVRVSPQWPPGETPPVVGSPSALQLTGGDISEIRIANEALLAPPDPVDEGLAHRALGQARLSVQGPQVGISNLGASGHDGVSIDVADRGSGIGVLLAPLSLVPTGTVVALNAVGTFDHRPNRSMGTASVRRRRGTALEAMADFSAVGSEMVRVEVYHDSSFVGSALVRPGVVATAGAGADLSGLDAVGWIPPCYFPAFVGISQSDFEPVSCYFFHFDKPLAFTVPGAAALVGNGLRLLQANAQPRAQSLSRFEIRTTPGSPNASFALLGAKLRLPTPEVTRIFPQQTRAGEIVEIRGRGFGGKADELGIVGSTRAGGLEQLTVPFEVLSASDTRILARVGNLPPGTPAGPIRVFRGVSHEGNLRNLSPDIEILQPIRGWTDSTPAGSWRNTSISPPVEAVQVYTPGKLKGTESWFYSEPVRDGVLTLYIDNWFPNAVVSFSSHLTASFREGGLSVDGHAVRLVGGADVFEGAKKLAEVIEAAFLQMVGLTVNVETTRPQPGAATLTLSLPNGQITGGFLNACVRSSQLDLSMTDVNPKIIREGNLVRIAGRGFGEDARDLRAGLRDPRDTKSPRFFSMDVLQANDTQILARMGPTTSDFTSGPLQVLRGTGYRVAPAESSNQGYQENWRDGIGVAAAAVTAAPAASFNCAHSTLDHIGNAFLVLTPNWQFPVEVSLNAEVRSWFPGTNEIVVAANRTLHLGTAGSTSQKIAQIADALEAAVAEAGFALSVQVTPFVGTNQHEMYLMYATMDEPSATISFSVCIRSVPRDLQVQAVSGDLQVIKITGHGFGTEAEDLSVALVDGGGSRLIPLVVSAAADSEITAQWGALPPDARPGPIMVRRGRGSLNPPEPFFDAVDVGTSVFTWTQPPGTGAPLSAIVMTLPTVQSEPGRQSYFSSPPTNGELSVVLNRAWPSGAIVRIAVALHDTNGAAYEMNVPAARFLQVGNLVDGAERIADVIRSDFWQQAGLVVDATVMRLPEGSARLSLRLADGGILRGFLTVELTEPPRIATVESARGGPGDTVVIAGQGFGNDSDDILVYVDGGNGVRTLLPVVSVTATQIVATVGIVRPDAQAGLIVVARGQGGKLPRVIPGLDDTGLQQWVPRGEVFVRSDKPFDLIQPSPTPETVCFKSIETNGTVCVEVEGDWPQNVRVIVEYHFTATPPDPLAPPSIFSIAAVGWIDLPGGSALGCAQAICTVNDGRESFPFGTLHCVATQTGPNRSKLTFSADVPIYGLFNICYNKPLGFQGVTVQSAGLRAQIGPSVAGSLRIANLGASGLDGARWELGQSPGAVWDIRVPATLPTGARIVLEANGRGDRSNPSPLVEASNRATGPARLIQRTTLEWLGADLQIGFGPSPVAATRYRRRLFRNGVLVYEDTRTSGIAATVRGPIGVVRSACFLDPIGCSFQFENPLATAVGAGLIVQADTMIFLTEDASYAPEFLSSLAMLGSNLPEFTIDRFSLLSSMSIRMVNGNAEVTWTSDGRLEESNSPFGPWRDVVPAPVSSPYLRPADGETRFFRLRQIE